MVLIGCSGNRPTASSRTVRDWGCRKLRTVSKVAGAITSRRLLPNFENSLGQVGFADHVAFRRRTERLLSREPFDYRLWEAGA